jgi:hypothetical protein
MRFACTSRVPQTSWPCITHALCVIIGIVAGILLQ